MQIALYKRDEIVAYTEVDSVDHLWASQYRWHLNAGYAARSQRRGKDRKPYRMFLHREILGLKHSRGDNAVVDHVNGDPLDCRRANLRVVSYAENAHNRKDRIDGTSRHRGVSWFTNRGCWRVQVMVDGHRTIVGYFDDEAEAGKAAAAFYAAHMPHRRQGTATALMGQGPGNSEVVVSTDTDPLIRPEV